MPASQQELLPESIASRLTEEQRQAVLEAPRGNRLSVLFAALGIDENAALTLAAQASGLDIATNLETDPGARGLLPARLVHDFQIIPIRVGPPAGPDGDAEPTPSTPLHLASAWLPDASMDRLDPDLHAEAARLAPGGAGAGPPAHHRELRRRLGIPRGQRRGLRRARGAAERRGGRRRGRGRGPVRERRHHPGRRRPGDRHPFRAPGEPAADPLPGGRAAGPGPGAREPAPLPGRDHLAAEDHGAAQHLRAEAAPGRQDQLQGRNGTRWTSASRRSPRSTPSRSRCASSTRRRRPTRWTGSA
jgi:hypothetical protein